MPWQKVGKNDYTSPSGRHWTKEQIAAYEAKVGDMKGGKKPSKGGGKTRPGKYRG